MSQFVHEFVMKLQQMTGKINYAIPSGKNFAPRTLGGK
jgi:hypothetical protein